MRSPKTKPIKAETMVGLLDLGGERELAPSLVRQTNPRYSVQREWSDGDIEQEDMTNLETAYAMFQVWKGWSDDRVGNQLGREVRKVCIIDLSGPFELICAIPPGQNAARIEADRTPTENLQITGLAPRNRETWLYMLAQRVTPWFEAHGYNLPKYRIGCGLPFRRGLARKSCPVGECWTANASTSGHREIFVSPELDDPVEVAQVVVHELIHAALPDGVGHRWPFRQAMKVLHLEGKPTATVAGDEFRRQIAPILEELGEYPHSAMILAPRKKRQNKSRYKITCTSCGFVAYAAAKWLREIGSPLCRCSGQAMEIVGGDEFAQSPSAERESAMLHAG